MIVFKPEVIPSDICKIDPYLRVVLSYFEAYCVQFEINHGIVKVTSIMSDIVEGRISDTHKEGRAVDVSLDGISEFHRNKINHFLNSRFAQDWGTRPVDSDKKLRVCVIHDSGRGIHCHLQVRRGISFDVT